MPFWILSSPILLLGVIPEFVCEEVGEDITNDCLNSLLNQDSGELRNMYLSKARKNVCQSFCPGVWVNKQDKQWDVQKKNK